jgi:hypothetical protein
LVDLFTGEVIGAGVLDHSPGGFGLELSDVAANLFDDWRPRCPETDSGSAAFGCPCRMAAVDSANLNKASGRAIRLTRFQELDELRSFASGLEKRRVGQDHS